MSAPIALSGDAPRARRSDPETSHEAADKSARNITELRLAVLQAVAINELAGHGDGGTGSEINEIYRQMVALKAFPRCHPDSPRKRAGELADDGYLDVVDHREGLFGSREAAYALSPEGRALLERQAA